MLYLEDFLEVVEGIPSEVKEKNAEIRELDLGIHNTSEHLDEQMKSFFSNAKRMKSGEKAAAFEKIRRQYYKLLDDADEKVSIASNLHDSLERYVRRIDVEIEKFKCELEADSPGVTEVLEKKSLELDEPSRENQKENRTSYSRMSSLLSASDWRHAAKKEDPDPNLGSGLSLSPPVSSSSLSYTLGHIGAGGNAIAAAASQAIAATQQMRHGRRTASLAASFDAVSHGVLPADLSIGSELALAAKAALAASSLTQDAPAALSAPSAREGSGSSSQSSSSVSGGSQTKRQKKGGRGLQQQPPPPPRDPAPSEDLPQDAVMDPLIDNPDWTYDPNEPRYCVCNQVSYGNMVACDNPKCPLEWFHYACVSITAPPKGKWFCPQCAISMNRRQRK
ncbi:UNVERIFIED_CONTAM: hypothetical protein GTU68_059458 [Idotea baltica]|nr:hypothetical protein [Idotea baltica]